jgi:copper(I)-binding protein
MPNRSLFLLVSTVLAFAPLGAAADEGTIRVTDAYARASSPVAMSGAAFLILENSGDTDARLVGARSDAAERIELHTHIEDANGVMRMIEIEDGIVVPAGGEARMERGADHVMLMGLTGPLEHGGTVTLTLVFEPAQEITVDVPVDLERKPASPPGG